MDRQKLKKDLKQAVQLTVKDADSYLLDKMESYSNRISQGIIDYVAIPDPTDATDGYAIVVRNGLYVLEECCHGAISTNPLTTQGSSTTPNEPTQPSDPVGAIVDGKFSFDLPIQANEGSFDVMNVTNGLSVQGNNGTKSELTSQDGSLFNNGDPVSSTQLVFSDSSVDGLQDSFLKLGSSPYMINTFKGKLKQVEVGYTLNAIRKAPRKLELIVIIEDVEYPLYTMTEDNDPDDFVKAMQRVSLTSQDFGEILLNQGDLVKIQFKQGQYEITDISVSLNIGG